MFYTHEVLVEHTFIVFYRCLPRVKLRADVDSPDFGLYPPGLADWLISFGLRKSVKFLREDVPLKLDQPGPG